ncbi:MAG: hypothetical protein QOD83_4152 [Solirubrobacteraceae bacterium]|jgi:hypothetical protein|nr:hypothetical protein [Solirubrobacteraceae bacterium]
MTGEWILLLVGVVLPLIAVLTARARGLRRGLAPRIAAAATGLLCVAAAVMLMTSAAADSRSGPFSVAITDQLGPGQLSERIRVLLDGRGVGLLEVNRRMPRSRVMLAVAHAGRHRYELQVTRRMAGGKPVEVTSGGQVDVADARPLVLYADETGRTYLGH